MSSAWGVSWLRSWGNSWGLLAPTKPTGGGGGGRWWTPQIYTPREWELPKPVLQKKIKAIYRELVGTDFKEAAQNIVKPYVHNNAIDWGLLVDELSAVKKLINLDYQAGLLEEEALLCMLLSY